MAIGDTVSVYCDPYPIALLSTIEFRGFTAAHRRRSPKQPGHEDVTGLSQGHNTSYRFYSDHSLHR